MYDSIAMKARKNAGESGNSIFQVFPLNRKTLRADGRFNFRWFFKLIPLSPAFFLTFESRTLRRSFPNFISQTPTAHHLRLRLFTPLFQKTYLYRKTQETNVQEPDAIERIVPTLNVHMLPITCR